MVKSVQSCGDEILESSDPGCRLVVAERITKEELGALQIQPKECPVVRLTITGVSMVAVARSIAGTVVVTAASILAAIIFTTIAALAILAVLNLHWKNAQNVVKGLDVEGALVIVVGVIVVAGNINGEINRKDENFATVVVHVVECIKTSLEAIDVKPLLISETGSRWN